jgi:hypothetical protein
MLRTLEGHSYAVFSVGVTPDGRRAVSGSGDNTLRVWDLESGECLRTLEGHSSSVDSVGVTPDGRRAVSGSDDNTLRVWDLESGECLCVSSSTAPFTSVALKTAGNLICAGTSTGEVLFLELHGVQTGPVILTAANPQQVRCPACGQEFVPARAVVAAIRGADAMGLSSECPHCHDPLQFNPFFAATDDYADVLRRGLELSRREKDDDHEETLAHLAALAVYLTQEGKPDEAAEYQREYDERAGRAGS